MRSRTFEIEASGPLAVFTRPEMKVERVSYEVMTPSAARGVLEAILWKPAIRWIVEQIVVLKPVQWTSFRRNEVNSKASLRTQSYFADEDRAQRNTVALKDVGYLISAHFRMTEKAGPSDNPTKFEEMFQRRLEKGQTFQHPYLGCRELAADVRLPRLDVQAHRITRPLGLLFYDFDYACSPPRPLFFDARLDAGVLTVPAPEAVLDANGEQR